jgi:4-amino-4-deoxy-L-arabinose transferase-like glycosyltransferase
MNKKNDLFIQWLVLAAGIFFFVPFLGRAHLFDWDEINFAEAAREMLATGNFLQVQNNFQPFWEKPPLFFWMQALSMSAFGVNEFAARFVNALCGIVTLLVVYRIGKQLFDRRFGLLWAGAFLGSFLPHLFFKSGIIDPVFNLFIFLGIYFIFKSENSPKQKSSIVNLISAGVFLGLASLTKGPVAILVPVLCICVYWIVVRFRKFLSIRGIVLCACATAVVSFLWYGIETLAHGPWFVTEFIKYQIRLFSTGDAGHGRPFWFHFVVLLFGCFPASFLAIRSFLAPRRNGAGALADADADADAPAHAQRSFRRWMLVLFWVVLVLFSIVKTKTVLYSSLAYFPITFLAAYHMHGVLVGKYVWNRWLTISLAAFGLLVAAVITVFPVVMMHTGWFIPYVNDWFARECLKNPVRWEWYETLVGAGYMLALIGSIVALMRKRFVAGFGVLLMSTALCLQAAMILFVPKMETITDAGPIHFYESCAGKNVYARSLFKTYADLFYFRKQPGGNPKSYDREWLLTGPIDKPAYFVCRIDKAKEFRAMRELREIKEEYGYVYFMRDVPSGSAGTR